ncbi:MAG: hypothetical protein JXA54_11060 [Candidatus Heimdallarchaeota archaeon]|nr:hypothetical protein [Candidatus Heimdallarchaeota archaeon]
MDKIKFKNQIVKGIKRIIISANNDSAEPFFDEIKEFQELARKIPENEQEKYEKYFEKYMIHEINLLKIDFRKIDMNYQEIVLKTNQQSLKFENLLANKELNQDMRNFYQREYLNILKPQFIMEQVRENYEKYLEVVRLVKEEFTEWFFLGRIDFLKQLLKPYISEMNAGNKKKEEIWIYKKYAKELTPERITAMYKKAGLKVKK